MPTTANSFNTRSALTLLGEMARVTGAQASSEQACHEGLALICRAVGAAGGCLLLVPEHDEPRSDGRSIELASGAVWGACAQPSGNELASRILETGVECMVEPDGAQARVRGVALLLCGSREPLGALVLDSPGKWSPAARSFAVSAARMLATCLDTFRVLEDSRAQRQLLRNRNTELEVLRELAERLQAMAHEDEMLQAALDLVLERLGLHAGWIFWGESRGGILGLAASRGIAEEFIKQARETGIGPCLCRDVFETGKLRYARNTIDCPRLPALVSAEGNMTHACIPLKFDRGILGVMNVANLPGRVFSSEELHFLETVGNQVCLAVDKALTARAESRRDAEARALGALAKVIGGSLDQERVIAAVGDYARTLLSANGCAIFLGDGSGPWLLAYLSGSPLTGLEVGRPADLAGMGARAPFEALARRGPVVIPNSLDDPLSNAEVARRWGIGSALLVPLIAREKIEGILFAYRSRASSFSPDEVDLANALAGQAAVAIVNARLFQEARDALLRLQEAQYGMMQAERLATVGTLASSLAHEVRNPLNSINLQLVLLSRRATRLGMPAREELTELIETARREITRLDALVEEFLSLSTIDRVSLAEESLNDVIREVMALMSPVIAERGMTLSDRLATGLPRIRLDREKIKQVLINLMRNAIEAMAEGGILTLGSRAEDGWAVLSVSDTGGGIETGLDVFDFFTTTKRRGSGLGLPIARRIVEAHGGSLTYESRPGHGTTFSMTLRAIEPAAGDSSRGPSDE